MLRGLHSKEEATRPMVAVSASSQTSSPISDVEHLTQEEVQEVVALWTQQMGARQNELPRLADVAAALDVSEEEAHQLLMRARQMRQTKAQQRRRSIYIAVSATLASLAVAGSLWNAQLARINQQLGPFSVVESKVIPLNADALSNVYGPGANVTRVDVLFRYHPPSLWRAIVGPNWQPSNQMGYLTDGEGRKYEYFSKGSEKQSATLPRASMTSGWFQPRGGQVYSFGYAYPTAYLPSSVTNLTLHGSIAADNHEAVPFFVDIP